MLCVHSDCGETLLLHFVRRLCGWLWNEAQGNGDRGGGGGRCWEEAAAPLRTLQRSHGGQGEMVCPGGQQHLAQTRWATSTCRLALPHPSLCALVPAGTPTYPRVPAHSCSPAGSRLWLCSPMGHRGQLGSLCPGYWGSQVTLEHPCNLGTPRLNPGMGPGTPEGRGSAWSNVSTVEAFE